MRGFKLHSLYSKFLDGTELCQVIFPHLLGSVEAILVTYEAEVFPSTLEHHPKMELNLCPPAEDHWNVTSDWVLPVTMEDFWCRWEANVLAWDEAARGFLEVLHSQQVRGPLLDGSRS